MKIQMGQKELITIKVEDDIFEIDCYVDGKNNRQLNVTKMT